MSETAVKSRAIPLDSNKTNMPRRRFSLVLTGARGTIAKDKYLERLKGMGQGEGIGTKGNRPNSKKLYVQPFGQDFPADMYIRVSALEPAWVALSATVAANTKETIATSATALKLSGFKAARLIRRTKDSSGTASTSKLTGLKYLKYNSTSLSVPFGRKNATESEGEAQTAFTTAIGNGYKVSFLEERM